VRTALQIEHGNEAAIVIRGLLEAQLGRRGIAHEIAADLRRKNEFSPHIAWIMSNLDAANGLDRSSFNYFTDLRPERRYGAECYRDMGRSAERLGQWGYAARWYRESAAAHTLRKNPCLTELSHLRLDAAGAGPALPFWMAFDEFYVTGSLAAYLAYAFERFEAATDPAARERWGGLVVNAAGTSLRLDLKDTHARKVRGLVYARTGHPERALADLQDALSEFSRLGISDSELEAEIGHVLLLQRDHRQAIVHLRRALALAPGPAQAWSDLGLCLIMSDERDEAVVAFGKAIERDAGLVAAWYNRGLVHLHAGDLPAAEVDLAQAARLAPDNRDIVALLQQVMRQIKAQTAP
jgi:tetratricopeptide (TPR) repeat protein